MAVKKIPLTIQTLYADLVQKAHAAEPGGSTYVRKQVKVEYIYGKRTLGAGQISEFLGRADDERVQARAERYRKAQAAARERRKIVSMLKSAGLTAPTPQVGIILEVLADAGLFDEGQGVLVGTAAYQSMDALLGVFLPSTAIMTGDVDVATATLALRAKAEGDTMEQILKRADESFRAVGGLDRKAWPWRFRNDEGFFVELLMPVRKRNDESPARLRGLKAGALRMQQIEWLIENPVRAVALYGAGVPIRVPDPARYAIHKMIVAKRRGADRIKARKDLEQASAIWEALSETDSGHLQAVLANACRRGKRGWEDRIKASCKEMGLSPRWS
jgi:hypothetical protein